MDNVLSQNEVNALLNAVKQGDVPVDDEVNASHGEAEHYDLTSNDRIVRGRMPTLDILNQRLGRLMRQSLFNMFRKTVEVTHAGTKQLKYGDFTERAGTPACLNVFRIPPLKNTCILAIDPALMFGFVDHVFGGTGAAYQMEGREYSAIELRLIKQVTSLLLADMRQAWEPVIEIEPEYVRTEMNAEFAAICAPTDAAAHAVFDVAFESSTTGQISFLIPYAVIEPVRRVLSSALQTEGGEGNMAWRREIAHVIRSINIDFKCLLGSGHLRLSDLMRLEAGDTIRLNADAAAPLPCLIEGVEKGSAWPVVSRGRVGVELDHEVRTIANPKATLVTAGEER